MGSGGGGIGLVTQGDKQPALPRLYVYISLQMQRSVAMLAFISVLEKTGACPSCGNPICSLKAVGPPSPPHPSPSTVREPKHTREHAHQQTPAEWRVHTNVPVSGSLCALEHF